jgi:large subunit ribosomal protein L3
MPLGLLGKKLGHTRVYNAQGVLIPVTVVLAGPNRVLQVKTQAGKDGYNAVQLGFGSQKPQTKRLRRRRGKRASRPPSKA